MTSEVDDLQPTLTLGARCVCDPGGFSIAGGAAAFCFDRGFSPSAAGTSQYSHYKHDTSKGLPCSICPPCLDCSDLQRENKSARFLSPASGKLEPEAVRSPGVALVKSGWATAVPEGLRQLDRMRVRTRFSMNCCHVRVGCKS